jgi:hypothetical protein
VESRCLDCFIIYRGDVCAIDGVSFGSCKALPQHCEATSAVIRAGDVTLTPLPALMATGAAVEDGREAEKPSRIRMPRLSISRVLSRIPRRGWRWIIRLAVLALVLPLLLQWLVAYIVGGDTRLLPGELQAAKNLLVVTAHPDDECLFFAPSILRVLDGNPQVQGHLLSLSNGMNPRAFSLCHFHSRWLTMSAGNNYGKGDLRLGELKRSCAVLHIPNSYCEALDHANLQDNPKVWWDTDLIQKLVDERVKQWSIDVVGAALTNNRQPSVISS